jgi:uncharacterized protein (DUF1330 family)
MKAYLVLDLTVNDFGGFRKYIAEIPAFIARHSGKYIVQGAQPMTIEGDWKPERMVILEFPAREKAQAFLGDPEIQDLFKVRHDTTTSKLVLVDGCTNSLLLKPHCTAGGRALGCAGLYGWTGADGWLEAGIGTADGGVKAIFCLMSTSIASSAARL